MCIRDSHYNVGCHAADNQIDAIFAVGELSKELVVGGVAAYVVME